MQTERRLTWNERRLIRAAYQRERLLALRQGNTRDEANARARIASGEARAALLQQRDMWIERDERARNAMATLTRKPPSSFVVVHEPKASAWYDWIDPDTGDHGQCQRSASGVSWAEAPRGNPVLFAYRGGDATVRVSESLRA